MYVFIASFAWLCTWLPLYLLISFIYAIYKTIICNIKQFTHLFQVNKSSSFGEGRTTSFLLSLQVLLTVALISHGTNTSLCSFQSSHRSPVPSLLPSCTSSSWQLSPGCSWRGCSSTSCWWRFLRASTPGGSISIWWGTACLR